MNGLSRVVKQLLTHSTSCIKLQQMKTWQQLGQAQVMNYTGDTYPEDCGTLPGAG